MLDHWKLNETTFDTDFMFGNVNSGLYVKYEICCGWLIVTRQRCNGRKKRSFRLFAAIGHQKMTKSAENVWTFYHIIGQFITLSGFVTFSGKNYIIGCYRRLYSYSHTHTFTHTSQKWRQWARWLVAGMSWKRPVPLAILTKSSAVLENCRAHHITI